MENRNKSNYHWVESGFICMYISVNETKDDYLPLQAKGCHHISLETVSTFAFFSIEE